MKREAKEFDVLNGDRPKVLLLGNGINLVHGGCSWNNLLNSIKNDELFVGDVGDYNIPMGLKATLLMNDNVKESLMKMTTAFQQR